MVSDTHNRSIPLSEQEPSGVVRDRDLLCMHVPVMRKTQENRVVYDSSAALLPFLSVMHLPQLGPTGATREPTVHIPSDYGLRLPCPIQPLIARDIDRLTMSRHDDSG